MTKTALDPTRSLSLRRTRNALALGVALVSLTAAAALAQSPAGATQVETAIPAPAVAPPAVGEHDFDPKVRRADTTGSVDPADASAAPAPGPAATPAPAPAPAVVVAVPADPIAAAVVALFADQQPPAARLKLTSEDRTALKAFYESRAGAPVWLADGRFTPKAEAAKKRIAAAAGDALDPARFHLPNAPATNDPAAAARADVDLSAAALDYAREAWGGRVDPGVISPNVSARADRFEAAAALASLDGSRDVAATLDGFNPQHPQFQALRKLLAEARVSRGDRAPHPTIGFGKLLRPGEDDPRVPALRTRLGLTGDPDDFYYDTALADAVEAFQRDNKIAPSGLINRQTLNALNAVVGHQDDSGLIALNMERWRWMPRDLGAKHVFVDLAAFELHVMQDGRAIYDTRVIIGKATNQTPLLSSAINQIVVNPYWNVPVSIALKELSKGSLRGFEVVDSRGHVVDASSIDWSSVKDSKMRIRQPPGERNALGHIKFQFPNSHAVYLHDTSSRGLFAKSDRAMSHGCVRVDKPLEFADALSGDQGLSGEKLQKMVGGKERGLPLGTSVPVHLAYFTAWVGEDGRLSARPDLYGIDERLQLALRGEPLPPIPVEKIALPILKPKAKPAAPVEAQAVPVVQPAGREHFGSWLSRIFGDSRY